MQISYSYVSIYELTAIKNMTRNTAIHIFHNGICPQTNSLPHCTYMFHCTNNIVYMSTPHYCPYKPKKKHCNFYCYQAITIYVPTTILSLKCNMCQLLHVQVSNGYIIIYTSYELTAINNMTRNTAIHIYFTITYAPEQIACHTTHMSHYPNTVVYMSIPHYCPYKP